MPLFNGERSAIAGRPGGKPTSYIAAIAGHRIKAKMNELSISDLEWLSYNWNI